MSTAERFRYWLTRGAECVTEIADAHEGMRSWQRERFHRNAGRFSPIIGVDDRSGNRYFVHSDDDFIGRAIFLRGDFDVGKLHRALAVLDDRGFAVDQVLDIGANIGTTTVELLSRLPSARAVAFEPEPANFRLLRHNILANDLDDRATAHQMALSDTDDELAFELSVDNPGDHRVRVGAKASAGALREESWEVVRVRARRFDDLVADGDIEMTAGTFACMDVQGHEAHVLDGGSTLSSIPLLLEFWPYGLSRAGGLDRLLVHLSRRELYDVTDAVSPMSHAALTAHVDALLEEPDRNLELLALSAPA